MNLHEYQAKQILKKYGILTSPFFLIEKEEQLTHALKELGGEEVVLKVQVHAGGRGKAGGVKIAKSFEEASRHARNLIGMRIVNAQTGKYGVIGRQVLISPLSTYLKEYYIGATIDRQNAQAVLIASAEGGMEIEDLARTRPDSIFQCPIPLNGNLHNYQAWEIAKFLGWTGKLRDAGINILKKVSLAFTELDASLIEINPLVSMADETLLALDAKLVIDDNALFRHPELVAQFDMSQLSPLEALASRYDLAYIALDGDIGCMVNGAGLAMATMDIIEYYGGKPANFLDVGGGATAEKVAHGFKIILSDPQVKAILVNIFGGIMNCETLAEGILSAVKERGIKVPLVVRMEGTNVEKGKELLSQCPFKIQIANSLDEAAKQSVQVVKNGYSS